MRRHLVDPFFVIVFVPIAALFLGLLSLFIFPSTPNDAAAEPALFDVHCTDGSKWSGVEYRFNGTSMIVVGGSTSKAVALVPQAICSITPHKEAP